MPFFQADEKGLPGVSEGVFQNGMDQSVLCRPVKHLLPTIQPFLNSLPLATVEKALSATGCSRSRAAELVKDKLELASSL